MRKISAHYIYTGTQILKYGIILLNDSGKITDVIDTNGKITETDELEFFNGILLPGFVNTHCHLELASYKNKIKNPRSLIGFIEQIVELKRNLPLSVIDMEKADNSMYNNGTVLVGDISNTILSAEVKQKSKIKYHTFVEISDLFNNDNIQRFNNGTELVNQYKNLNLDVSLVPHSFYTCSPKFVEKICNYNADNNLIMSVHNQESNAENDLYTFGKGKLYESLKKYNIFFPEEYATGKTSLQSVLQYFSKLKSVILVHNIYTGKTDLEFLKSLQAKAHFCLCPQSNLFLENKIADINLLLSNNMSITIGTDSLSSAQKLDILEELKIIQMQYPEIPLQMLIEWATINGAKALGYESIYGSIEPNKCPGILHIEEFDFKNHKLLKSSKVKRIV